MIVRLGTAPRADNLSYRQFQHYWSTNHADVAELIPGLRGYRQHHAILRNGMPLLPYVGFDACSELLFDSVEAMDNGFASDIYRSSVVADERQFIDKQRFALALTTRQVITDSNLPEDAVRLLSFWRALPHTSAADVQRLMADRWVTAIAASGHIHHEQLRTIPDSHQQRPGPLCDLVDILTFRSTGDALASLNNDSFQHAQWLCSGIAQCVGRMIARDIVVV